MIGGRMLERKMKSCILKEIFEERKVKESPI